jgi:2-amino-4-hydroxy-6-hydroxymethyldihydropteridine diphosphokinase
MGPADQPDYVNAVMAVDTTLEPLPLLDHLQAIETAHGRVRLGERWGPRTLDLDILVFGDQEIRTNRLQVPHSGMTEREFVLYPLMEVAPDLAVPGVGLLYNLVDACPRRGLTVMADE